jgi:uncharacterized protein with GYD domain
MPKYLTRTSHTLEGLKGLIKEGGTARRDAVEQAAKALGATVEAYYYAFGEYDLYTILDMPDNVTASAAALVVNAAGTAKTTTTVLITPEEVDQATAMVKELGAAYRSPGE